MKKSVKIFSAVLLTLATLTFTSCEFLDAWLKDTFQGPENKWLEMTVEYEKNGMRGQANLAFFYTQNEKVGHSDNNTRLKEGEIIESGLTVLCYGTFLPIGNSGLTENAYMRKNISPEEGGSTIWGLMFNASSQLRDLDSKGKIKNSNEQSKTWLKGESYGDWINIHPEDPDEKIDPNAERVPLPLTNQMNNFYFTNEHWVQQGGIAIDWNEALGKIDLSTSMMD